MKKLGAYIFFKIKTAFERLNRKVSWSLFRTVSNSSIVKVTVLIPILGYWILFNQNLLPYMTLSEAIYSNPESQSEGTIPLNLLLVYFGLCLIAVASALYQLFCPNEVKKYGAAEDYIAFAKEHYSPFIIDALKRKLEEIKLPEAIQRILNAANDHYNNLEVINKEDLKSDMLRVYYTYQNRKAIYFRLPVAIFYVLGFLALSIPSIIVFAKITSLVFLKIVS